MTLFPVPDPDLDLDPHDPDLEWVRLAPPPPVDPGLLAEALADWARAHDLWVDDDAERFLLVDLDNLRADAARLRARMALLEVVAEGADHVVAAGQAGAVGRSTPWLGDRVRDTTYAVGRGADLADHVLLDELRDLSDGGPAQVVVASNDNIFARIAERARLVVVSPGAGALSKALRAAAAEVVDLAVLEEEAAAQLRAR